MAGVTAASPPPLSGQHHDTPAGPSAPEQPCVGLFGVCAETTWRAEVAIPALEAAAIPYYNPQLAPGAWHPGCLDAERWHLANDPVVLFPVTSDSYGQGSLAELGFSVLRAVDDNPGVVVAVIDLELDPALDDPARREDSLRSRRLVRAHLAGRTGAALHLVDTVGEMVEVGIEAWRAYAAHRAAAETLHGATVGGAVLPGAITAAWLRRRPA